MPIGCIIAKRNYCGNNEIGSILSRAMEQALPATTTALDPRLEFSYWTAAEFNPMKIENAYSAILEKSRTSWSKFYVPLLRPVKDVSLKLGCLYHRNNLQVRSYGGSKWLRSRSSDCLLRSKWLRLQEQVTVFSGASHCVSMSKWLWVQEQVTASPGASNCLLKSK
jgi:hypothetical protein